MGGREGTPERGRQRPHSTGTEGAAGALPEATRGPEPRASPLCPQGIDAVLSSCKEQICLSKRSLTTEVWRMDWMGSRRAVGETALQAKVGGHLSTDDQRQQPPQS